MSSPHEVLDRLEALDKSATPGPWYAPRLADGVRHLERNCDFYCEDVPDGFYLPGRQGGDGGQRDGDFIAAARNTLPALVAVARAALEDHEARHSAKAVGCELCDALAALGGPDAPQEKPE